VIRRSHGQVADLAAELAGQRLNNAPAETDLGLIETLENRSLPIYCDEGRKLFARGETCNGLILESGEAALLPNAPSGRTVFCLKVGSGSLLGLLAVVGREPYSMTAIVKERFEGQVRHTI
jgi:hypothetical protein